MKNIFGTFLKLHKFTAYSLIISILIFSTGCSSIFGHDVFSHDDLGTQELINLNEQLMAGSTAKQNLTPTPLLRSGSLVVAKRMPDLTSIDHLPLYGFIPFQLSTDATTSTKPMWIEVDTDRGDLVLKKGKKELFSSSIKKQEKSIVKGIYAVQYQAKSPLWHATEDYFINRGLPVPAEGDSSRLLKGALGEHAIFLDSGLVIHSGEHELEEDYQIRITPSTLADIYQQVSAGTKIIVK